MIILGIDPGFHLFGFGVVKFENNILSIIDYGVIRTETNMEFVERLKVIMDDLKFLCDKYKPDLCGIEELFFAKNTKTALKVAEVRGAVNHFLYSNGYEVRNFNPMQIKMAVTGYGKANKEQMQKMVKLHFGLSEIPKPDDAADALAVCYCASMGGNL
ncbi:crossover junction endodeoxyribonuclease RuvC [Candidatus Peregrinibacteria bacterium RIFOXYA2_FULL_33_7]|nr:MAG: crossover junction endodeoxyribonuclease RuvC [Candidatus Peregrinibacteria bacterium RIFOXYA2_FULL_33_7]